MRGWAASDSQPRWSPIEERWLREAVEKVGAKPDDPIEKVVALLEDAGVDLTQPGNEATRDHP
jgi:hypothetical protein